MKGVYIYRSYYAYVLNLWWWVNVNGNSASIGITDHAQYHLGDVVYVELPEVGAAVKQGESFGAVESVKATSDVNSPVSGKVVEVNEELSNSPALASFLMKDEPDIKNERGIA
ncbi:hypothetical protein REPUB_Repub09cG0001900 [Reevesia pubescens]